jgi:hypothetical protein
MRLMEAWKPAKARATAPMPVANRGHHRDRVHYSPEDIV